MAAGRKGLVAGVPPLTIPRRQNVRADALALQAGKGGVQFPLHSASAAVRDEALEDAGGTGGVADAHLVFLIAGLGTLCNGLRQT